MTNDFQLAAFGLAVAGAFFVVAAAMAYVKADEAIIYRMLACIGGAIVAATLAFVFWGLGNIQSSFPGINT